MAMVNFISTKQDPVSFTRDTSCDEDEQYSITCFITGDSGRKWGSLNRQDRKTKVLAHLANVFGGYIGNQKIPPPIFAIENDWSGDSWLGGGPTPSDAAGLNGER
ncbi:hypothetical protein B0H63DRAFT_490431 [Podospora didyma]|uniref:Amine oxidase domain-containing protein n=1 Tax=Podospora didyma TaxID=330526 RepID=A0AAE0N178_9PEZI|nr:hypothetical protein B0H63DRAFT_490431 [Podospora didyma]